MGIFEFLFLTPQQRKEYDDRINAKLKPAVSNKQPLCVLKFPHSKHWKGFKRINLVNYKDSESEEGIRTLHEEGFDFDDKFIILKEIEYNTSNRGFLVYVDDCKIGAFFPNAEEDKKHYDNLISGNASAVHVEIEYSKPNNRYYARLYVKEV